MINEVKTFEERKEALIKKGKDNGFVTYEDLANELKGLDLDSDQLDELYDSLVENGIEIITEEEKNQVSHRGKALELMKEELKKYEGVDC